MPRMNGLKLVKTYTAETRRPFWLFPQQQVTSPKRYALGLKMPVEAGKSDLNRLVETARFCLYPNMFNSRVVPAAALVSDWDAMVK